MVQIPPEIWFQIAKYLPPHDLVNMIGLNSSLLEAAMDERYRRVNLCIDGYHQVWSGTSAMKNIDRISDTFVAKRVRSLCISPFFINDLVKIGILSPPQGTSFTVWLKKRLGVKWSPGAEKHPEKGRAELAEILEQSAINSIGGLCNVTKYKMRLDWDDHLLFAPILVTAGWSVFGKNLSKLSIHGGIEQILSVLPQGNVLKNLRDIDFDCSVSMPGDISSVNVLFERLASFITGLGSLRSLTLAMIETLDTLPIDVSLLFRALNPLSLHFLSLCIRFENLTDLSALAQFMSGHRNTLKHLTLRPDHRFLATRLLPIAEARVCQTLSKVSQIDLLSLELDLHCLSADSTLHCIQPFSNTSTSLVLTGTYRGHKYLTYSEVELLVSVFSHRPPSDRLTVLMLGVQDFNTRFIDLFSGKLPSLEKLCITMDNLNPSWPSLYELIPDVVRGQVNTEWKNLTSLWIGAEERLGSWAYMIALANHCIPSIRTFDKNLHWGNECGCGIITFDMVRSVPAQGDGIDDIRFAQFQLTPFACTRHAIKMLPTYDNGILVQDPAPYNPPSYNHVEF